MLRVRAIDSLARMEGWFQSAQAGVGAVAFVPSEEVAARAEQVVLELWGRAEQVKQVLQVFGQGSGCRGVG
jgi:hypothetical protein